MAVSALRTTTERNKLIAAILLGILAIFALYFAFGRSLFSSSATTAKSTPTPKPTVKPTTNDPNKFKLPSADEQALNNVTVVNYVPGNSYAPDAGRNIFAFYEPPAPTPYSPTPLPTQTPGPPPTPALTPPVIATFITPQSVYAGSQGFRLEVNGERFSPDMHIYFNQVEFPTTFINEQKMVTDIPANLVSSEGSRQVIIQSPDGKMYSNQIMLVVQAPPRPSFKYVGMIGRKRYNNDTAYFLETGKPTPFGARLNDVLGGRFRLISITPQQVTFEDTSLGFKHSLTIEKTAASSTGTAPTQPGSRGNMGFPGIDPGFQPTNPTTIPQDIPGIPNNIPRYVPPTPNPNRQPTDKKDVDDDGDDG
ncbi:MAG: hypothetical protein IPK01_06880 [Acidobacteria bacterium]|nr:hypothetical protein [Acidobacteriota bacterium]